MKINNIKILYSYMREQLITEKLHTSRIIVCLEEQLDK